MSSVGAGYKKLYEKIYRKAYQEVVKQSLPAFNPSLAKAIQKIVNNGPDIKKLEGLMKDFEDFKFEKKIIIKMAYQSDWTDKEEFEVLLFVAKKVFYDKFFKFSNIDRRMVYYFRRRLEVYKRISISSFLTEEEYLFLLKLRNIANGRLREDFIMIIEVIVKAMYLLAKIKELISKEKERLEEEAIEFDDKLVLQFVIQNYNSNYSKAFIKNLLRSLRRIQDVWLDDEEELAKI